MLSKFLSIINSTRSGNGGDVGHYGVLSTGGLACWWKCKYKLVCSVLSTLNHY